LPNEVVRFRLHSGVNAVGHKEVRVHPLNEAARPHAARALVRLKGHAPSLEASGGAGTATHLRVDPPAVGSGASLGTSLPGTDDFKQPVPDPDVISTQNIWGGVSVMRNFVLIATKQTNAKFVYHVPEVRMPTKAIPLINYPTAFDMASVVPIEGTRPLANWLAHFFAGLMGGYTVLPSDTLESIAQSQSVPLDMLVNAVSDVPDLLVPGVEITVPGKDPYRIEQGDTLTSIATAQSVDVVALGTANAALTGLLAAGTPICIEPISRNLRVSVDYGFDLASAGNHGVLQAEDQEHLLTRVPVYLRPTFPFNSAVDLDPTQSGLVKDLAKLLGLWADKHGLAQTAGIWVFDVSLYTTLQDQSIQQLPPLLEMTNIQLDRSRITPTSDA
jgi:LysM repeat protein